MKNPKPLTKEAIDKLITSEVVDKWLENETGKRKNELVEEIMEVIEKDSEEISSQMGR